MLAAVAPAPANAQAPLGLEEEATTPVARVVEPVSGATERVARVVEPVSEQAARVVEPVSEQAARVVEPVSEQAARVVEPVSWATGRVAAVAEPLSRTAGELAGAAKPVLDATGQVGRAAKPVVDTVAAPAVQLGGAAAPVRDVVDGLARPVGSALTGHRSSSPDRGDAQQPAATFGRLGSGGPPSGDAAGSKRSAADGVSGAGPQGTAPEMFPSGATTGPPPATGHGALPGPRVSTTALPLAPRADAPPLTPDPLFGLPLPPGVAGVLAPPSPETSTSTSRTDRHPAQISPTRRPAPAPPAPAGAAAAGSASGGSAGPVLALLTLLLLAAPGLSLFLRTVPEFLRPAPFIVALERPG